jgi:hypothetical protein
MLLLPPRKLRTSVAPSSLTTETPGTLNRPPDAGRRLVPRDLKYRNSVEAEVRKDVGATAAGRPFLVWWHRLEADATIPDPYP